MEPATNNTEPGYSATLKRQFPALNIVHLAHLLNAGGANTYDIADAVAHVAEESLAAGHPKANLIEDAVRHIDVAGLAAGLRTTEDAVRRVLKALVQHEREQAEKAVENTEATIRARQRAEASRQRMTTLLNGVRTIVGEHMGSGSTFVPVPFPARSLHESIVWPDTPAAHVHTLHNALGRVLSNTGAQNASASTNVIVPARDLQILEAGVALLERKVNPFPPRYAVPASAPPAPAQRDSQFVNQTGSLVLRHGGGGHGYQTTPPGLADGLPFALTSNNRPANQIPSQAHQNANNVDKSSEYTAHVHTGTGEKAGSGPSAISATQFNRQQPGSGDRKPVIPVQVAKTTTTTTTLNAAPAQSKTAAGTDHAPSQTLRTSHRNIQSIPTTTAAAHLAKLLGYDPEASAVDQGSGSAKINPIPILAPKKHTIVHSPGQSPERKKAILSQVDSKGKGQEPQPASTQQAPLPATKALLSEQNLRMQGMVEKPQRQNSVWTNTYVEDMRKRAAEAKVEKEKNETKLKKTEEDKATKAMKEMEKKMESELKKLDEEMLKLRKMMGARK